MLRVHQRGDAPSGAGHRKRPSATSAYLVPTLAGVALVAAVNSLEPVLGRFATTLAAAGLAAASSLLPERHRGFDLTGVVLTLGIAGGVSVGAAEAMGAGAAGIGRVSFAVLSGSGVMLAWGAITLVRLSHREQERLAGILRRLLGVWTRPVSPAAWFFLGALFALPFAALHSNIVWEADSARILASLAQTRHFGWGHLLETQESSLPHLVLGPMVALWGIGGASAWGIAALVGLSGMVAYIAGRLSDSALAAVSASLGLLSLSAVISQTFRLPMYLTMLALGVGAGWLGYRALDGVGRSRLLPAAASGLMLVLAAEAHGVGQIFFALPALLLILRPTRRGLVTVALIYAALAFFFVPRAAINLAEGGLDYFRYDRTDYFITEGYLRMINEDYHGHPVGETPASYAASLPWSAGKAVGGAGMVAALLAVVGASVSRRRGALFGLSAAVLFFAALVVAAPPQFPRYFTPLMPGMAIVAGFGLRRIAAADPWRVVTPVLLVSLLAAASVSYVGAVAHSQERRASVVEGPYLALAARVPDGDGVIGVRAHRLHFVDPSIRTYGSIFLTEEEFLTYLTWPSDEAVLAVMEANDIEWVLLIPSSSLEVEYHAVWVEPTYGRPVRHPEMIARSEQFCLADQIQGYRLYRLGPCVDP